MKPEAMIQNLRHKLGMSMIKFALKLGYTTYQVVWQWETGRRSPCIDAAYKLIALAKTQGMEWTLEELIPRRRGK